MPWLKTKTMFFSQNPFTKCVNLLLNLKPLSALFLLKLEPLKVLQASSRNFNASQKQSEAKKESSKSPKTDFGRDEKEKKSFLIKMWEEKNFCSNQNFLLFFFPSFIFLCVRPAHKKPRHVTLLLSTATCLSTINHVSVQLMLTFRPGATAAIYSFILRRRMLHCNTCHSGIHFRIVSKTENPKSRKPNRE